MSRSELHVLWVAAVLASATTSVALAKDYGLGRPATPAEIAEWDIDVRPDGQGLPRGRGSVAEGQVLYDEQCASCHGTFGEGGPHMALAGGVGSLKTATPMRTIGSKLNYATTLFDYIYRAMPFHAPKSLTIDQTYAVSAYVLHLNDILPADAVLDQDSLPKVVMPNRDGYTRDHGMGSVNGKPDVHNTLCMKSCEKTVEITSQLPPGFTEQVYGDVSKHFRRYSAFPGAGEAGGSASAQEKSAGGKSQGLQLAQQHGCMACHGLANRIVGPGFSEIAARYQGQADARTMLMDKLVKGGAGNWGAVPMPPQTAVPETDRQLLVEWILRGVPE
ncbi:sulfur dehydrogenase subunit SoxD [Fontimonas thermophila]|uniref:Cytochrome c-551 n=1 Tax=Fontimonas thermophila TaxID=1076937 RepID=A0A1I2IVQ7_9GAMM|nr:c-type cytochrome [Fontimonas thermophila]SFF45820.1 sulfur dehydrogenase subunit SoxD [Fontimonas thermophila]